MFDPCPEMEEWAVKNYILCVLVEETNVLSGKFEYVTNYVFIHLIQI
jgi:hypothetical protein